MAFVGGCMGRSVTNPVRDLATLGMHLAASNRTRRPVGRSFPRYMRGLRVRAWRGGLRHQGRRAISRRQENGSQHKNH